ncbi:MAG: hypothetical protein N3A38_02665 [Planctomycetota bacterium]|nr:hypothetical protein [Planctomycetota bacterium]
MWIATFAAGAENPLSGLPSKPEGPHIEKIRALGDNSWAILGQAAPDPKWGREGTARGRAFSPKMACARDLGGAFFCGTGVHGAKRSDGRYMDDLWFYDANAHRWICLYPGAGPDTKLHLDKNGFEVDEAGNHVPVSYLSHAYYNTTYNPDLKLYHIMWTQCPWWYEALPQRWAWLDQKYPEVAKRSYGNVGPIIASPKHPLFWDVANARWERKFVEGPGPGGRFEGVAEYIPSLKKTVYVHNGTTWLYDYASNSWTAGPKIVPKEAGTYEQIGCYDSKRERLYAGHSKKGFGCLDLKTMTWQEVRGEGQPEDLGTSSNTYMAFDSASGVIVWKQPHGPVVVYDPDTNKWTDMGNRWVEQPSKNPYPDIPCPKYHVKYMVWHGFYNAELNAHFFYIAGDSGNTDANFLVYRYRNAKKE